MRLHWRNHPLKMRLNKHKGGRAMPMPDHVDATTPKFLRDKYAIDFESFGYPTELPV